MDNRDARFECGCSRRSGGTPGRVEGQDNGSREGRESAKRRQVRFAQGETGTQLTANVTVPGTSDVTPTVAGFGLAVVQPSGRPVNPTV